MNEKGGNAEQAAAQVEQKKQEQHIPWYQHHQQQRTEGSKRKNLEEIPVLHYGPNNSFAKFKEA
jgi:hypothetical protein